MSTKYVILTSNGNDDLWHVGETVEASSADAAVRAAIAAYSVVDANFADASYVAVPARSWQPLTVTVQTTRRVHVAPADATTATATPE